MMWKFPPFIPLNKNYVYFGEKKCFKDSKFKEKL